jgi:hypothetical protein
VRVGVTAAVLVVAASSATWGGGPAHARATSDWPSARELAWIRGLGGWEAEAAHSIDVLIAGYRSGVFATSGATQAGMRTARGLLSCTAALHARAPTPPTTRLEAARAAAGRACVQLARVAHDIERNQAFEFGQLTDQTDRKLRVAENLIGLAMSRASVGPVRPAARTSSATAMFDHVDPRLGTVASRLASRPIAVYCWSSGDWRRSQVLAAALNGEPASAKRDVIGTARVGGNSINLRTVDCRVLERLAARPQRSVAAAYSLRVLAHETQHTLGDFWEDETECHAIQRVPEAARLLGVPAADAHSFADVLWRNYWAEPRGYHTPLCRNGGPFDLRPRDAVWP